MYTLIIISVNIILRLMIYTIILDSSLNYINVCDKDHKNIYCFHNKMDYILNQQSIFSNCFLIERIIIITYQLLIKLSFYIKENGYI